MTTRVLVVVLHRAAAPDDGPLHRALIDARALGAERHRAGFMAAGADEVRSVAGPPDGASFGERLAGQVEGLGPDDGLVVLGSGAVPLIRPIERRRLVERARGPTVGACVNNPYSADVVGIARAREAVAALGGPAALREIATDNVLPRRLVAAGVPVTTLGGRAGWRLGVDLDSPLDVVLLGRRWFDHLPPDRSAVVTARLTAIRARAADPRAELLVAGRTSAAGLAWLERRTASRTRALIEERGLRTSGAGQRAPVSVLGTILDREGPTAVGTILARLGDAALVDTRVLLAHRHGADESAWPPPEDRFASDLLLPDRIGDAWLRAFTASVRDAPIPVLLGAHTLVGPGLRLALGGRR